MYPVALGLPLDAIYLKLKSAIPHPFCIDNSVFGNVAHRYQWAHRNGPKTFIIVVLYGVHPTIDAKGVFYMNVACYISVILLRVYIFVPFFCDLIGQMQCNLCMDKILVYPCIASLATCGDL